VLNFRARAWGHSVGTSSTSQSRLSFGLFSVDLSAGALYRDGRKVALQGKPFRILAMLLEQPGEVVTREDIRKQLWPDGTFVDFNEGIDTALKKLRYALGDSAQNPIFIETIPRRGYRFIAPVTNGTDRTPAMPEAETGSMSAAITVRSVGQNYVAVLASLSLLAALGYAFFHYDTRSRNLEQHRVELTRLTDHGQVQGVAISPDGRYVAYARGDDTRQSLWLEDLAARSDVEILPGGPGFHGLTFSPDGTSIYLVRSDPNDPAFKYLYLLPTHGGAIRKLITDVDSPVSFSPEGKQFVYERCVQPRNYIEIKVANADGSNDHVLNVIQQGSGMLYQPGPNWSPDGENIAVPVVLAGDRLRWVLDIVSLTNGSIREMYSSSEAQFLGRPVWIAGGKSLLFPHIDNPGQRYQLWTMSFPEGKAQPLTHDLTNYGSDLDMTRDGRTFVTTSVNIVSHPWVAPASDLSQVQEITADALPLRYIAEAPDGKLLLASADNAAWTMYTDGSQRRRFTEVEPIFEPTTCGRYVILRVDREDAELVRFEPDGSHPTVLARGEVDSPVCSADHTAIFYYTWDPPQRIWKVPLEGGPPQRLADALGDLLCQTIAVSPDGKYLVYPYTRFGRVPSEGWKLAVIPINGGPPVRQFAVTAEASGVRVRWSSNSKGLQYVVTANGVSNLWEQALSGGNPKQLTRFASGQIFDFNWTPDGTRLLMARGSLTRDAVLLRGLIPGSR
jgi:DNA-binding winged helix-turn-helix (wHTH) protein/Tol biopolymer transport system component